MRMHPERRRPIRESSSKLLATAEVATDSLPSQPKLPRALVDHALSASRSGPAKLFVVPNTALRPSRAIEDTRLSLDRTRAFTRRRTARS